MEVMAHNINNKPANRRDTERGDKLDRALDAALATYAAIEPRTGLNERILARLESASKSPSHSMWRRWSAAAAVFAAVIVTIGLAWRRYERTQPPIANRPPTIQRPNEPATQFASNAAPSSVPPKATGSPRRTRPRHLRPPLVAAQPKLDQFPSPQPLSAEDLALVRYVRSFPKEATLIAQAQEQFALETQKIMDDAGSQNRPFGSIQEER